MVNIIFIVSIFVMLTIYMTFMTNNNIFAINAIFLRVLIVK